MPASRRQGITLGQDVPSAGLTLTCDVCIVGSGAGGSVLAAGLAERGVDVIVLEEGGYVTKADFDLQEAHAYPFLYQGRGGRATVDQAIAVLQGRSVGGSTTVNWTTCYRTPDRILAHWAGEHGVDGLSPEALRPHFDAVEARLGIETWPLERANAHNRRLIEGCQALGWAVTPMRRNVRGCGDTGYCGVGCPLDAKQAMHLTYLPDAFDAGARLYCDVRAERIKTSGGKATGVEAAVLDRATGRPTGAKVEVKAKVVVSSGGAINGPALLLRSGLGGPRVGHRTMLHPVVAVMAVYPDATEPWRGAPQSAASHQHIDRGPSEVGFFLECPPLQPMLAALGVHHFGASQQQAMKDLPRVGALLALSVDGLIPESPGGVVSLRDDGRIALQYDVSPTLAAAFRAAHVAMAKVAFAAGAQRVQTSHLTDPEWTSATDAEAALRALPHGALEHAIFTAHQMGGLAMGADPARHVVDSTFRVRGVEGLFAVDGSVFPTALGVNPSETIYALARHATSFVADAVG